MKTILIIAGTRPEIIKTAPVIIELRKNSDFKTVYCLTGQHITMAQEALSIFNLVPDEDLNIMRPNQTLNMIAESVFAKLPPVLEQHKPDVVLVQGDTTTAAMAALACFNMKIPVGHIEAGLRSFNMNAPYPEECNRRLISVVSKYNFCPTDIAKQNLLREAVPADSIYVTGNTVVDALMLIKGKYNLDNYNEIDERIRKPFVLITAHRRESFGKGFENICEALKLIALKYPEYQYVYPVHLNPNVKEPVYKYLSDLKNIVLIPPLPYLKLLVLLKNCEFVITDSGGIQEEAPSFRKHCIVLREVTERMESVNMGMSELVGTDVEKIIKSVERTIKNNINHNVTKNPYGDGHASKRIVDILRKNV